MAYTDDAVLAKLSALNETQESIVTVAQWVMFHRRHADRTGQLWLQRLRDSGSNKRLNLIYLANGVFNPTALDLSLEVVLSMVRLLTFGANAEVAQQSKARRKDDFLIAFSPVIAEATATAYKGATNEVQQKLRRVVEVWRQRQIFEIPIQEAIESRIDELDKSRSTGKRGFAEGSLFSKNSGGVPAALSSLVSGYQSVSKLELSTRTSTNAADQDYEKLTDPKVATPSAPVHAARLNGLLKTLANAEGAVTESMKARNSLISELEQILKSQHDTLREEDAQLRKLSERRAAIDAKKKDVEDAIMRGFASNSNPTTPAQDGSPGQSHSPTTPGKEPDRPEVEALTPPTQSPITPERDLQPKPLFSASEAVTQPAQPPSSTLQPQQYIPPPSAAAGLDLLASLSAGQYHQPLSNTSNQSMGHSNGGNSAKKRKLNSGDDFPDLGGDAMDDIDDDVAEMLRG